MRNVTMLFGRTEKETEAPAPAVSTENGNYELQSKSAVPSKAAQTVLPDSDYYGLSSVSVEAIPDTYQDVTPVTTEAAHVLEGDIFVDSTGAPVTGTMPNNGAIHENISLTKSYTVPKGYHNGEGKVYYQTTLKTVTPTKETQTVKPAGGYGLGQVTVLPIPDAYQDVTPVTTEADHVLEGDIFVDATGAPVTGTMPNNGAVAVTVSMGSPYTIPKGYHDGRGTVTAQYVDTSDLNYKVVGGTSAPANPTENTIWVNTSTEITSHVFSATQPGNLTGGLVWFKTGDSSNVSFNALKENALWVYPISCRQRTASASFSTWIDREVKIYQNGAWVTLWNGIFNDAGQIFTSYAKQENNGTVAINTDGILFTTQKNKDSKTYMRYGPIRIDGINSISADFEVIDTVSGYHYCYLFVGQNTGMTYADAAIKAYTNPGKGASSTTTLDLSTAELTGDYYVYVGTEAENWTYARSINNTKTYATR